MLPMFLSAVYGLVLLTSLTCAVIIQRPLRALSEQITTSEQGRTSKSPVASYLGSFTLVVAALLVSTSLSACAHNAVQSKAILDAGRVD